MKIKEAFKNKITKRTAIGLLLSFIILLLEVFLFNYRAFIGRGETVSLSNTETSVSYATLVESAESSKPLYKINGTTYPSISLTFDEEKDIRTVAPKLDFVSKDVYRYEMSVTGYYTANGSNITVSSYRKIEWIKGFEYSRYYEPEFNHSVKRLVLTITSIEHIDDNKIKDLEFTYSGVDLNYKVPFNFSLFRFLGLNLLTIGTYLLVLLFIDRHNEAKTAEEKPKKDVKKLVLDIVIYALPIIAVMIIYAFYCNFCRPLVLSGGTQLSQELVDAFLKGHVYLDIEPSPELLALENPYDRAARAGVSYYWDHLLYNGKYYSYYGITPVFMLFLPFKVIFGYYLADAYVALLFTVIALVFMALSYETLIKQIDLKNKVPLFLKYGLYLILAIGSGACFQVMRPYFYEVSTSCAFMCMMIALFHLLKSGLLYPNPEKKHFYYHLIFSSLWCALAVLARATCALYAAMHLVFIGYYFFKNRKDMNKKGTILYFVLSLVPYVVFGSIQCIYNYLRFGSIFDFGIEYSITVADFKNMPFHPGNVLTSIFHFLFNPGGLMEYPPFIPGNTLTFGAGYYYYESKATVGLFARMPILFGIFVLPFFITTSKEQRIKRLLLGWLPCVLIPFIQVCLTWQSGYATRYYTDISWPLLFFAVVLYLKFYDERATTEKGQLGFLVFLCANILVSFVYTLNTIFIYIPSVTQYYGTAYYAFTNFYYRLMRQLSFWR